MHPGELEACLHIESGSPMLTAALLTITQSGDTPGCTAAEWINTMQSAYAREHHFAFGDGLTLETCSVKEAIQRTHMCGDSIDMKGPEQANLRGRRLLVPGAGECGVRSDG